MELFLVVKKDEDSGYPHYKTKIFKDQKEAENYFKEGLDEIMNWDPDYVLTEEDLEKPEVLLEGDLISLEAYSDPDTLLSIWLLRAKI